MRILKRLKQIFAFRGNTAHSETVIIDGRIISGGNDLRQTPDATLPIIQTLATLPSPETETPAVTPTTPCDDPTDPSDYLKLAESLCAQGNRDGIWIALSLLGVKPSYIETLTVTLDADGTRVSTRNNQVIDVPAWLYQAMQNIAEWKRSRNIVHREVAKYGTHPQALNAYAKRLA